MKERVGVLKKQMGMPGNCLGRLEVPSEKNSKDLVREWNAIPLKWCEMKNEMMVWTKLLKK